MDAKLVYVFGCTKLQSSALTQALGSADSYGPLFA